MNFFIQVCVCILFWPVWLILFLFVSFQFFPEYDVPQPFGYLLNFLEDNQDTVILTGALSIVLAAVPELVSLFL